MIRTLILGIALATSLAPAAQALVMFSPKAPQVSVATSVNRLQITPPAVNLPAVTPRADINAGGLRGEPGARGLTGGMPGPGPRQGNPVGTEPMPDIP